METIYRGVEMEKLILFFEEKEINAENIVGI